ncbi:MAG: diguanylate cyclase [Gemmataceae bacterium]|nr:diguanylate cyclase [Gemmataceae bacterium]
MTRARCRKGFDTLADSLLTNEHFFGAFDHFSVGLAIVSPDGRWLRVNPAFCAMLGYSEDELRQMTFVDVSHPDDVGVSITRDCELLGGDKVSYQLRKRYLRKDGGVVWALVNASLVRGADGRPSHFVAQILDVTAQHRAEEALRESEERYRELFESASDMIQVTDATGRFLLVNRAWRDKLGYSPEEISRLRLPDVLHPEHRDRCMQAWERLLANDPCGTIETPFVARDGRTIVTEGKVSCSRPDASTAIVRGIFRDITERRLFEELLDEYRRDLEETNRKLAEANARLELLATTDPLTGLNNRLVFQHRLEDEFQRTCRYGVPLSLALLDVDRFKSFNDTYGHPAGDAVLVEVGRLLRQTARITDLVARFGGEEFAILLPNTPIEGAIQLGERFRRVIETATWRHRPVTISVGLAAATPEMKESEALVSAADAALYRAKQLGRNRVDWAGGDELSDTVLMLRSTQS